MGDGFAACTAQGRCSACTAAPWGPGPLAEPDPWCTPCSSGAPVTAALSHELAQPADSPCSWSTCAQLAVIGMQAQRLCRTGFPNRYGNAQMYHDLELDIRLNFAQVKSRGGLCTAARVLTQCTVSDV
jgi:hypothetical protein